MPLAKQGVPFPLGALDTKTDPRQLTPGQLSLSENLRRTRAKELRVRAGCAQFPNSAVGLPGIGAGKYVGTLGDEVFLFDGLRLYSYSAALASWTAKGFAPPVTLRVGTVEANNYEQTCPDVAINGNYACWVWEDSRSGSNTRYSIQDLLTGGFVVQDTAGPSGQRPHVVSVGGSFLIFVSNAPNIVCWRIQTASITSAPTTSTLYTDGNAANMYDVTVDTTNGRAMLAYLTTTPSVRFAAITEAMAIAASSVDVYNANGCIGWLAHTYGNGNAYCGAAATAANVQLYTLTASTMAVGAITNVETITNVRNVTGYFSASAQVVYEISNATTYNTRVHINGAAVARSVGLASRAFVLGSDYYVLLAYESSLNSAYYLKRISSSVNIGDTHGKALYGLGGGLTARAGTLPSVASSGGVQYGAILKKTLLQTQGTATYTARAVCSLKMLSNDTASPPRQAADVSLLPGAYLGMYDGKSVVEHGFHHFPEQPTLTPSAGGAMTVSSTYQYSVVWSWKDRSGRVHRSAPSVAKAVVMGGADTRVTLTIPTLRLTNKIVTGMLDAVVEIYRTTANGRLFYLVNSLSNPLLNNPQVDTVTYVDTANDTAIVIGELLYTTGGVLDNIAPPQARFVEPVGDRIWIGGCDNPNELWPSKLIADGLGVAWNDDLRVFIDSEGGDPTGFSSLDGAVVVFKRAAIYVITGAGPDNTGGGGSFNIQRLPGAIGATDPRSIVRVPDGVMFKSPKGFFLLDRSFGVQYVGHGVAAYDGLTVTSAVVVDDQQEARFTTAEGRTLTYSWLFRDEQGRGEWFTRTNEPAVASCVWRNSYLFMSSAGALRQETEGSFGDAGTAIAPKLQTRLAFGGVQGFQRLYELQIVGEYRGAHTLKVTCDYTVANGTGTVQEVFLLAMASGGYPVRVRPKVQSCAAVNVTIEQVNPGGTEGGYISAIHALVGVKGRPLPLGTGRQMSPQ